MLPRNIDKRSDNNADEVGPEPAPSPCKTLCPIGIPSKITAFITPSIFEIYVSFFIKHGWTLSNNLLLIISVIPNNFILRSNLFAISISLSSIFSIPLIKHLFLEILLLNDKADKILIFAKTSLPSRSN